MQKIIVGNWKMHGDPAMAHTLTLAIADAADKLPEKIEVVLCPPAILIAQVATWLVGSVVKIGGQDCHAQPQGAYTGDISAPMLKNEGCSYVIVGHSERRKYHFERSEDVRHKASQAINTGLIPIICVGETEDERNNGIAEEIVSQQLKDSVPQEAGAGNFVLAYEPVWAIGSGKTPTVDDIRQMHSLIISVISKQIGLAPNNVDGKIHVLYGGSVKADNAREIMAIEGVSGVLVGGASLKAGDFCNIMAAAN